MDWVYGCYVWFLLFFTVGFKVYGDMVEKSSNSDSETGNKETWYRSGAYLPEGRMRGLGSGEGAERLS